MKVELTKAQYTLLQKRASAFSKAEEVRVHSESVAIAAKEALSDVVSCLASDGGVMDNAKFGDVRFSESPDGTYLLELVEVVEPQRIDAVRRVNDAAG